jgi:hypothetical protein
VRREERPCDRLRTATLRSLKKLGHPAHASSLRVYSFHSALLKPALTLLIGGPAAGSGFRRKRVLASAYTFAHSASYGAFVAQLEAHEPRHSTLQRRRDLTRFLLMRPSRANISLLANSAGRMGRHDAGGTAPDQSLESGAVRGASEQLSASKLPVKNCE